MRLGKLDKKAISAFLDQQKFTGNKLVSTGKRLDGLWMGGRGIAVWKGSKIDLPDLGSRAAQTVQRALLKDAPSNWVKNPYGVVERIDFKKAESGWWTGTHLGHVYEIEGHSSTGYKIFRDGELRWPDKLNTLQTAKEIANSIAESDKAKGKKNPYLGDAVKRAQAKKRKTPPPLPARARKKNPQVGPAGSEAGWLGRTLGHQKWPDSEYPQDVPGQVTGTYRGYLYRVFPAGGDYRREVWDWKDRHHFIVDTQASSKAHAVVQVKKRIDQYVTESKRNPRKKKSTKKKSSKRTKNPSLRSIMAKATK